jgi:uncharacterized protein YecE (DUF72 family)
MGGDVVSDGRCYIGTSGWSYSHWAKGRFYPKGLKQGDWLGYLSQYFSTVEVNASFYRLPREQMIERWCEVTGGAVSLCRQAVADDHTPEEAG